MNSLQGHEFAYGELCQIFLIWLREGGLSEERLSQFAARLLENFDLVPSEALELLANLPADSNDGLVMPLDLWHTSDILSQEAVVTATALAVIQNTALLDADVRRALQKEAQARLPDDR